MAHFQSFVCYKRSFDMRIVTCCWEKTLCDSVKYKNSPVGSLMWTWWWLLFCMPLSVTIGRGACVWERDGREITPAVFMHLYLCMLCIIALVWPIEFLIQHCSHQLWFALSPVWYYAVLLTSCLLPCERVCLCLCLSVSLWLSISPANWFVFPVY